MSKEIIGDLKASPSAKPNYASSQELGHPAVEAADRPNGPTQAPKRTVAAEDNQPLASTSEVLPPNYRLVSVLIQGQTHPAIENLPVEVFPCHTFFDLCATALARVRDAPQEYGMQAFLVVGSQEIPLQYPHTPAWDTLRSFSSTASVKFHLDPAAAAGGSSARVVRLSRLAVGQRRQRRWLRRLARVAVGVAKFVLMVEAAALLRGGVRGALQRLTGRGGSEDGDGDGGVGYETEAVLDAVADYVSGRGDLRSLERFDPLVVRRALEAMDTEVLEQLDVPDVDATREAVSELIRQLREGEQAAEAASAAPPSTPSSPAEASWRADDSATLNGSGGGPGVTGPRGSAAPSSTSARPSDQMHVAGEGSPAVDEPVRLPGFGPSAAVVAGSGSGPRSRGQGT
ncbi:hypothetical protein VOLCADRAFT_116780 [Volvox carteri f. nagariensis]|uniref:Uncharacterized protein n=1 Tax=Volvox carteri f. nagariensis TaxID=3068 RepID=D8TPE0_VOLCA|nr:uncharacterized protein VOLCADRAFT_116780 [Volvox carteri f. nagariensis]EFJ50601.1 hypothetical protein VOLCADRAFT_116780 [Volvox carteri f. nagariensis]|eukprot:XP_002948194.1 hypothetical protein VOLCADRAFT_116780 [Volvox carteri f. nagariensis]